MRRSVRAHFDGTNVVLDEPGDFHAGERLVITPDAAIEAERRPQSGDKETYRTLNEMGNDLPLPEEGEADLWEVIEADRKARRGALTTRPEPEPFS